MSKQLRHLAAAQKKSKLKRNPFWCNLNNVSSFWIWGTFTSLQLCCHLWINDRQPTPYMDELFHVPQAQEFCAALREWRKPLYNTAITTPPGLYVLPALMSLILPKICTTRGLRVLSAISISLCLPITAQVVLALRDRLPFTENSKYVATAKRVEQSFVQSFALLLHPTLFFYSNMYYTDVPAILFLLLCYWLTLQRRHIASAVCGIIASSYRQTNALFHSFIALEGLLGALLNKTGFGIDLLTIWPHVAAGVFYLICFYLNSFRAVLGDHSHHGFFPHYAMLCYFAGYLGLAICPVLAVALWFRRKLPWCITFSKNGSKRMIATYGCFFAIATFCVAVTGNFAHPFALADNRHFIFYVYRRILLRSGLIRLVFVPLYSFFLCFPFFQLECCRQDSLEYSGDTQSAEGNVLFRYHVEVILELVLLCVIAACVIPSGLLELRYFIPGFVFKALRLLSRSRLKDAEVRWAVVVLMAVNILFVYIFCEHVFTRPVDPHMPEDRAPGRFML